MNTRSVSKSAGRRLGMTLTIILLLLAILRPMRAAEIVITATGIIEGGWDSYPMFNVGPPVKGVPRQRDLTGQPFTLVFTFDDTKGKPSRPNGCRSAASGIMGEYATSPGIAVLTIAGKSFTFGTGKKSHSAAWRSIAASCSKSELAFEVHEGDGFDVTTIAQLRLFPAKGKGSLTQNPDWKSPLTLTDVDDSGSHIEITDFHHEVKASLVTKMLTVAKGGK